MRIGISNARPVQGCPPPLLERNRPDVASKLRGRVACLGYWGRRERFGAEPSAVAGPPSQRAAPPAWRPLRPSLQLRTSGSLPARNCPAARRAHQTVRYRSQCERCASLFYGPMHWAPRPTAWTALLEDLQQQTDPLMMTSSQSTSSSTGTTAAAADRPTRPMTGLLGETGHAEGRLINHWR
jgi:hypothetical protein